jgi:hypothetical protein
MGLPGQDSVVEMLFFLSGCCLPGGAPQWAWLLAGSAHAGRRLATPTPKDPDLGLLESTA